MTTDSDPGVVRHPGGAHEHGGHTHTHEHGGHAHVEETTGPSLGPVVLDIGGDFGAAVVLKCNKTLHCFVALFAALGRMNLGHLILEPALEELLRLDIGP